MKTTVHNDLLDQCVWILRIPSNTLRNRDDKNKLCCIVLSFPECIASLRYIKYKKFRRDKISDKCFDENFFDEISNETKAGHVQIFCF